MERERERERERETYTQKYAVRDREGKTCGEREEKDAHTDRGMHGDGERERKRRQLELGDFNDSRIVALCPFGPT